MKQLKTILFTLPFALAAVGCSQDELLPDGGKGTGASGGMHEVDVTFNVGANAGLQTRAETANPRPLDGPENWQRVTNMRIYVFHSANGGTDDDYTYYKPKIGGEPKDYLYVSDFYNTKVDEAGNINNTWGDDPDEKENEEHTVSAKMELEKGYYKFLAVGRDDIIEDKPSQSQIRMTDPNMERNDYTDNIIQNIARFNPDTYVVPTEEGKYYALEWKPNQTKLSQALISSANTDIASELFSGCSAPVLVQESGGFSTTIELKRAVAGLLLYIKNIPVELASKITITEYQGRYPIEILKKGTKYTVDNVAMVMIARSGDVILSTRSYPAQESDLGYLYTMNSVKLEARVLAIDKLGETHTSSEGYYTDIFTKGTFLMPQIAPKNLITKSGQTGESLTIGDEEEVLDKTLYLVFYHSLSGGTYAGLYPIDWRPIKIISSKDSEGNPIPTEQTFDFDILANQLYSLGSKDDPIDLKPGSDDGNLVITVNPDWDWKGDLEWAD